MVSRSASVTAMYSSSKHSSISSCRAAAVQGASPDGLTIAQLPAAMAPIREIKLIAAGNSTGQ